MPPRPIVNDALWRCLCPGYAPATSGRLTRAGATTALRNATPRSPTTKQPEQCQLRTYNTPSTFPPSSNDPFSQPAQASPKRAPTFLHSSPSHPRGRREKPSLVQLPTVLLYEHLRVEGAKGRHDEVMNIVKILVKDRRERPNKEMYAAILHSFASCREGTAGKVRAVLEEMGFWGQPEGENVELDGRGCECVIEALAVHPDYLLRAEILAYMKARWFILSDRGHNFVVAGLLRDRLFEQALEKLDEMIKSRVRVEPWLWDKTVWMLLEYGEVEEALYVLSMRGNLEGGFSGGGIGQVKMSEALWGALLDNAAKRHLHDAASVIWNTRVVPGYLKPATNACLQLLSTASRHGDVKLATDIFRVLTERDTPLTTHHYELLIACYLAANDLSSALSVILIMQDSGLKVITDTVHPLYTFLSKEPGRPIEAFSMLQESEASGRNVPTAAVNACLQASIRLENLEQAIEIYKALHTVSKAGPNTHTFNILFQGCHKAGRKELAMFLANEMIQLNLKPDRITYDRLILVCARGGDINDALLYFEEMRGLGFKPRRGTYELLVMKSVEVGDERAVAVLRDYKESGETVSRQVERAVREKFEEGQQKGMEKEEDAEEEVRNGGRV